MGVGFENLQFHENEMMTWFSPRFHLLVLSLVYIKGIRRQGESKISCLTPVMESFSSDLLRAIISYWTRSHLESVRHPR